MDDVEADLAQKGQIAGPFTLLEDPDGWHSTSPPRAFSAPQKMINSPLVLIEEEGETKECTINIGVQLEDSEAQAIVLRNQQSQLIQENLQNRSSSFG